MFKGFYNLTSGMLSQTRNLDVISNNMGNISTPGYKADTYVDTTFREMMFSRVGNRDKTGAQEIGSQTMAVVPSMIYTDYTHGSPEETGQPLDFAINGEGFFQVQGEDGNYFTRSGAFIVDNGGFLTLPSHGHILDRNGQPIYLGTDDIRVDTDGSIFRGDGTLAGRLGVFDFAEEYQDTLSHVGEGVYRSDAPAQPVDSPIHWKILENSNVDMVREMTRMLSSQRALQSAAQVLKIYDQLMTKATTEIGRV